MSRLIDLTGKKFGRLEVKEYLGAQAWLCKCDCGNDTVVIGQSLRDGKTKSCKCIWRERMIEVHKKHGKCGHHVYMVWKNMKERCLNKRNTEFHNYGGRGIAVCKRWIDSFDAFWNDFGKLWPGKAYQIDRINNDGNYEPGNVRWATTSQQSSNRRRTHMLTYDGRTMVAKAWSREWGIPLETVCWWVRKYGKEAAVKLAIKRLAEK